MSTDRDHSAKRDRLRKARTLNRSPEKVRDPMFATGDFFDPEDLLQVRYEMVRLVRLGGATLAQAKRGPRAPHKITPEILKFARTCRQRHGRIGAKRLVPLIEAEFGVRIHPRGLEKALARAEKKTPEAGP